MALAFVMLGVFGIVSFSVSRRTPEFGIRMAIGASRAKIVVLVLRQSVVMAVAGTAIGLWLALLFGKVLGKLPFRVEVAKGTTLVWAVGIVSLVVIAAGYLPARRASRVSPLAALRHE
jgi:ABC-type antimicrobial peptide transport system permease subunit